jgi:tetratricopeptide (TPR) repeat protein
MTLRSSLLRQLESPKLNRNSRAEFRCEVAREMEETGNYEDARQALGELWQRIGEPPNTEGLEIITAAEVILRAGVLSGWISDKQQIEDGQETAKNLISESLAIFESVSYLKKILEAQTELAYCYWREGAYDEARIILKGALSQLTTDNELKAKATLRLSIVERSASRFLESLRILIDAAPLFEKINNDTIKGGYHNTLANVWEDLANKEEKADYIDRAFVEYTAASYHFGEAGHKCYRANVENNLGFLYFKAGRFKEAHRHLDRARALLATLKDKGTIAQVDETRARVFLAQGKYAQAEKAVKSAVRTLETGGRQSLLAEALTTQGIALAHLGFYQQARSACERAIEIAQQAGAPYNLAESELSKIEKEIARHHGQAASLGEEVRRHEHDLIEQALKRTEGCITHAARLLGISYQHLDYIIEHRHKDLIKSRTPKKQRPKRK